MASGEAEHLMGWASLDLHPLHAGRETSRRLSGRPLPQFPEPEECLSVEALVLPSGLQA